MTETLPLVLGTPKRKRADLNGEARFSVSPGSPQAAKSPTPPQPSKLESVMGPASLGEYGNSSPRSNGFVQGFRDLSIAERAEGPAGTDGASSELTRQGGATTTARSFCWTDSQGPSGDVPITENATRFDFSASNTSRNEDDMQLDSDKDQIAGPCTRARASKNLLFSPQEPLNTTSDTSSPDNTTFFPVALNPTSGSNQLQKSNPPKSRRNAKPRTRTRAATPPPSSKRKGKGKSAGKEPDEDADARVIVDPERAAQTWQEDEITIYDPEDKDDDGTGINGIGFKPTAAVAFQRAQKRRQQLAEYRKREENEARASRNKRRCERLSGGTEMVRQESIVRVHFSDAPSTTIMTT